MTKQTTYNYDYEINSLSTSDVEVLTETLSYFNYETDNSIIYTTSEDELDYIFQVGLGITNMSLDEQQNFIYDLCVVVEELIEEYDKNDGDLTLSSYESKSILQLSVLKEELETLEVV